MTPLSIAVYCGLSFMFFTIISVILQARKMKTFHQDAFKSMENGNLGGAFSGMMLISLCGLAVSFSAIGGVIALLFHFFG